MAKSSSNNTNCPPPSSKISFNPIYSAKTIREINIQRDLKLQTEGMAPPILFYSPNRIPDSFIGQKEEEEHRRNVRDIFLRRSSAIPVGLKNSASMMDLLPSRFPIEDEATFGELLPGSEATMICSPAFTSSMIIEEEHDNKEEGGTAKRRQQQQLHNINSSGSSGGGMFNRHQRSLSKIFKNFRHQIERTKTAFRSSSHNEDDAKSKMPSSRSFPIASSTSMVSLENYWRRSILHTHRVPANVKEKQILLVTEPFAATNSDQLSVQSGQKVELLQQQAHSSADQQPQSSAAAATDFVKVALIDAGGTKNTNRPIGLVPRRCLTAQKGGKADTSAGSSSAAQGVASRPSSHHHDCEETASSGGGNKRTSIRRFFTSSQKAESGSSNKSFLHQNQPSTSSNGNRPTSSSNFRAPESTELAQPHNSVLSPSNTAATTAETSASSSSKLAAVCAVAHNDLDLPPPMDQLVGTSAAGTEVNRVEASTADMATENQQISTDQPNSSNANETSNEPISSSDPQLPAAAGTPVEQMSAEDSARLKRSYVLQELVETERAYVQDLTSIVEGYIGTLKEMDLSDEDREKIKIIFANIEQILDFHKTHFCKEIEKSLQDHEAAGNAFIKYERRLHTNYVKYCQNKPKSDFLVSQENFEQLFAEIKEKLGHKVALSDLLIKPVQRITKYQLMLNDVLKYTHRAKDRADVLEKAHAVMRVVPKACDDMMQVGRLQGFQGSLNAQGRLIFQGTLLISDGGTAQPFKGKERRLFLFEQSVLFAECIPPRKEYGNPTYNFKNQIMVNKMVLEEQVPDEPLRFLLQSNDPNQPATYIAQAASAEDKEQWLAKLSAQLDQQKTFLAALVDPKRYQNQLANSVGSMSIGGKKDSSGSLGTPTSPAPGGISPTKQTASAQKSSSKLFGFSKQKS